MRLANLRSGDIDFMHLVSPTDAASLKKEGQFEVVQRDRASATTAITINLRNKNGKPPRRPATSARRWPTTRGCARRSS